MGNPDTMSGAHALASDAVLVTSDRGFNRIRKLKVENWTSASRGTAEIGAGKNSP